MVGRYVKNVIYEYLKDDNWLSVDLAKSLFCITNLKEVLEELKGEGVEIIEVRNVDSDGVNFRYVLKKQNQ